MSSLIKGAAAGGVQAFPLIRAVLTEPAAPAPAPVPAEDPRIALLAAEVEALRAQLAAAREEAEQAVPKAREEGRREGMLAALRDDAKRIEALAAGIATATAGFEARIADLDGLAALVARSALGRLFDRPELNGALVAAMVARQMESLRRESVLCVRVSAADFPDGAALAAFSSAAGLGSTGVAASADLEAGESRIDLQLGHVDVGPRAQWPALAALLDEMAGGGEAA